ncbi:hypothetical protein Q9306_11425 [Bacillus sp. WLY-B-L8]|nr:hypothetical protein [Bacillus sp. WLY-B-L8]
MKTKGITRGEILLGMEQGHFKEGDVFKRRSDGKEIKITKRNRLRYSGGNHVEIYVVKNELWDYQETFKVGDWIVAWSWENVCKIIEVDYLKREGHMKTDHVVDGSNQIATTYRKATVKEIANEIRRRMFGSAGRELNEFKIGDCVKDGEASYMKVEDVSDDSKIVLCSYYDSNAGGIVRGRFRVVELMPVYFVENIVQTEI